MQLSVEKSLLIAWVTQVITNDLLVLLNKITRNNDPFP